MAKRERAVMVDVNGLEVVIPQKRARKSRQGSTKHEEGSEQKVFSNVNTRKPLRPLNNKQKDYINAIETSPVVIAIGVWGSSKSFIPATIAADWLMDKKINKLIIARPTEGKGKTVGLLPGDLNMKLAGWVAPIADTMRERMGGGHFQAMLESGKIELLSLEMVKGRSWDDCMVLIDEAEDLDAEVAKSLVGRQGLNTTTVITGDLAQQDIKRNSGLKYLLDVAEFANLDIPVINFDSWEYCVRSEEAKKWGMAFEAYENRDKEE